MKTATALMKIIIDQLFTGATAARIPSVGPARGPAFG
jgi:hypothetical protein